MSPTDHDDSLYPDCSCNSAMVAKDDSSANPRLHVAEWSNIKFIRRRGIYTIFTATRYGRKYFIKSLPQGNQKVEEWQRLLFKEFELGAQLDHPHVARTVAWEIIPGIGEALVTEYIEGIELREWIREPAGHSRREKLHILKQIAEALVYTHSLGISHRDLKPDNILITNTGQQVKIIDFGLGDGEDFIVYKRSAGTRNFGAPEQGSRQCGEASTSADIYSLGKIMELMLPGYRYKRLISRCLRENPSDRPSAHEVLKTLSRKRYFAFALIGLAILGLAVAFGINYNRELSEELLRHAQNLPPAPTTIRDTMYVTQTDTLRVEVPAAGPSDAAIQAVWDKLLKSIDPQIDFFTTHKFPDNKDHSEDFEQIIPQWKDQLYYSLLEIDCPEPIAKGKSQELETYMRRRAKENRAKVAALATDTLP